MAYIYFISGNGEQYIGQDSGDIASHKRINDHYNAGYGFQKEKKTDNSANLINKCGAYKTSLTFFTQKNNYGIPEDNTAAAKKIWRIIPKKTQKEDSTLSPDEQFNLDFAEFAYIYTYNYQGKRLKLTNADAGMQSTYCCDVLRIIDNDPDLKKGLQEIHLGQHTVYSYIKKHYPTLKWYSKWHDMNHANIFLWPLESVISKTLLSYGVERVLLNASGLTPIISTIIKIIMTEGTSRKDTIAEDPRLIAILQQNIFESLNSVITEIENNKTFQKMGIRIKISQEGIKGWMTKKMRQTIIGSITKGLSPLIELIKKGEITSIKQWSSLIPAIKKSLANHMNFNVSSKVLMKFDITFTHSLKSHPFFPIGLVKASNYKQGKTIIKKWSVTAYKRQREKFEGSPLINRSKVMKEKYPAVLQSQQVWDRFYDEHEAYYHEHTDKRPALSYLNKGLLSRAFMYRLEDPTIQDYSIFSVRSNDYAQKIIDIDKEVRNKGLKSITIY